MFNHVVPAPYYFDYLCSGVAQDDFGNEVCTDAIDLTKSPYISYTGVTSATEYWQNVLYYAEVDAEGDPIVDEVNGGYKRLSETVETRDLIIYGYFTDTNTSQTITNLYYKGQISAEDTCYVTNSSNGQTGRTVCVPASDDGAHLVNAFGGVSSAMQYDGVTHIYDVSWTGPFAALNLERKISDRDELNLYIEYFIPKYKVWGDWPNRSDWAHNPSFYDKGGSASAWLVDFNYKYRFKENLYAGIGAYFDYIENKNADTLLFTVNPLTHKIESTLFEKSILKSEWKSYGFNIGLTYRF